MWRREKMCHFNESGCLFSQPKMNDIIWWWNAFKPWYTVSYWIYTLALSFVPCIFVRHFWCCSFLLLSYELTKNGQTTRFVCKMLTIAISLRNMIISNKNTAQVLLFLFTHFSSSLFICWLVATNTRRG